MRAFHTLWTRPQLVRSGSTQYAMGDFDIVTMILSALEWRAKNGEIALVADSGGADYIRTLGLDGLYSEISTELDDIPRSLNPDIYWAGGKLYALKNQTAPVVMIDTDFIVWEKIYFDTIGAPAAVIHKEDMYPDIYPSVSELKLDEGYTLPPIDETVLPSNTAFAYFADDKFLHYYTDTAVEFMEHTSKADNFLTYMVFAEQRLISICAANYGFDIPALDTLDGLFAADKGLFTHTWGFKEQMRRSPEAKRAFLRRCTARIREDFPEFYRKNETVRAIARVAECE